MDALGLQPILDYLALIHLPYHPSILKDATIKNYNDFNWVRTIATTKKLFGGDVLIGFDIHPDPTNKTMNRLVFTIPKTGGVLPM